MSTTVKLKALDGSEVEFVDKMIGQGGMKDVFFSPDKSYVVAFLRDKQDFTSKERLQMITGKYRDSIFNQPGGDYWKDLYCWPTKLVEYNGKLGLVAPTYPQYFFFQYGSVNDDMLGIQGKEKEGKWFASAGHQNKFLDPKEKGDWFKYFLVCLNISRGVARMHAAGLAHSDLSYKNVLIDPSSGRAAIIDIDGLVVPGRFPPDVLGTPDFIAPEVYQTLKLSKTDPNRKLPCRYTDLHALAVLIYMYLLYRHPLRGGKVHDLDPGIDEELSMGIKALFIENPKDNSNRPNLRDIKDHFLPQADITKIPYSVTGPYLKPLFDRAFIDGLHNPNLRPIAAEWKDALIKSIDLMQPCQNPNCRYKWFVFDNSSKPICPFCKTPYKGLLPVLNFYSARRPGQFTDEKYRLMVYHNQYLYPWHVNYKISPSESLTPDQKKPVGYFVFHENKWLFVNQTLSTLTDISNGNKNIPIGSPVVLSDGKQILLSKEEGGRLIVVQLVSG